MKTKLPWDRYQIIDKKLRFGRQHTVKQIMIAISNSLEPITDKQVRNDFERMGKVYGAPIVSAKGGNWTYSDINFTISKVPINDDDEDTLKMVGMTLQPYKFTSKKYNSVVDKILKGIDTTQQIANNHTREDFNFLQPEVSYGDTGYQWIEPIFKAILNKEPIEIIYQKYGEEPTKKIISPYILKEFRKQWYLIGYDHSTSNLTKLYALDRINEVRKSKLDYYLDPNFYSKDFFKHSYGIFHNYNDKPIKIELEFYDKFIQQVTNHPLMPTQKHELSKDKKILKVELELYYSFEIVRELLGYGDGVKVISPEFVAIDLKQMALKIAQHY